MSYQNSNTNKHNVKQKQTSSVLVFRVDNPELTSEELLQQVLRCCVEMKFLPFVPSVNRQGKPYFEQLHDIYFNISHTRGMWICALATFELGIDIEKQRPCDSHAIAHRCFHPDDQAWLKQHPQDFFYLWTRKESFVKLKKTGFDAQFNQDSVCPTSINPVHYYPLELPEDYFGTLCSYIPIESMEIKFFQKKLL